MRVLVGPRTGPAGDDNVAGVVHTMAGGEGEVVSLREIGVRDLSRQLSAAEVALLREALGSPAQVEDRLIGYVCRGVASVDPASSLVAVSDHVNLTWRSPLAGPNDEAVGPRFPSMTGIYAPETVVDLMAAKGIIVMPAVVAGGEGRCLPERLRERDDRIARLPGG